MLSDAVWGWAVHSNRDWIFGVLVLYTYSLLSLEAAFHVDSEDITPIVGINLSHLMSMRIQRHS